MDNQVGSRFFWSLPCQPVYSTSGLWDIAIRLDRAAAEDAQQSARAARTSGPEIGKGVSEGREVDPLHESLANWAEFFPDAYRVWKGEEEPESWVAVLDGLRALIMLLEIAGRGRTWREKAGEEGAFADAQQARSVPHLSSTPIIPSPCAHSRDRSSTSPPFY